MATCGLEATAGLAKALAAAARFVDPQGVAVVLDVKKSHDVFGESIAYALALDVAVAPERRPCLDRSRWRWRRDLPGHPERRPLRRSRVITRAGRDAFAASEGAPESSRFLRVSEAIGKQVDAAHGHLDAPDALGRSRCAG